MLDARDPAPTVTLSHMNFGAYPSVAQTSRIAARFYGDVTAITRAHDAIRKPLDAEQAMALGLITVASDELDWDDEVRLAIEERTSLSPDALTGMEANLRFGPGETVETRIFGRLSGWQNWIFIRPNAVGQAGALKVFGTGTKAEFDWNRV
jgi:benzoyl-CoA-dihydrodiol lyase